MYIVVKQASIQICIFEYSYITTAQSRWVSVFAIPCLLVAMWLRMLQHFICCFCGVAAWWRPTITTKIGGLRSRIIWAKLGICLRRWFTGKWGKSPDRRVVGRQQQQQIEMESQHSVCQYNSLGRASRKNKKKWGKIEVYKVNEWIISTWELWKLCNAMTRLGLYKWNESKREKYAVFFFCLCCAFLLSYISRLYSILYTYDIGVFVGHLVTAVLCC